MSAGRAYQLGLLNQVTSPEDLAESAYAKARALAMAAPAAVRMTKQAINRSYDAMGLRQALRQALEIDIYIESCGGPEREEFNRIRKEEGLKAAIAWRDARAAN